MPNSGSEPALGVYLNALRRQQKTVSDDLGVLAREAAPDDELAAYFIGRLQIGADNALGSVVLAETRLSAPAATLTRSMLENVITTHWASLSDSNARAAQNICENEILHLMKRFLSFMIMNIASVRSLLDALHRIVINRIRNQRVTTVKEIADILKLPEVASVGPRGMG
jgi:hypothetical protein